MWNWVTPEAEGVAIAAVFIVIAAFASWRMGKRKRKPATDVLARAKAAGRVMAG